MKLTMKNFKKYIDQEYDFGEEGLCLISGESGSGKTTILQGIFYCLYGSVSKFLPHSKPKSKCEVTLSSSTFFIRRVNSPKTLEYKDLITDETYEGKTAQAIINEKFGELFSISSYIQQNAINSFVTMSPSEKMSFLEKFAFQNIDFEGLRKKVSDAIDRERQSLQNITGQLQHVSEYFSQLIKPEKRAFPSLNLENKTKEEAADEHYKSLEKYKSLLSKTIKEIENISKLISVQKVHNEKITGKQTLLETHKKSLEKQLKIQKEIFFEGDDRLTELEQKLAEILKEKEKRLKEQKFHEGKKNLEFMMENERKNKLEEKKNIEENLWSEYSEEEIDSYIKIYTDLLSLIEELKRTEIIIEKNYVKEDDLESKQNTILSLEKESAELSRKIHTLEIQKNLLVCPSCETVLKLENKELKLATGDKDMVKEVEKINESVAKLDSLTSKITKLKRELFSDKEKLKNYKEGLEKKKNIEKKISEIKVEDKDEKTVKEYIEYFTYTLKENRANAEKLKRLESDLKLQKFSKAVTQLEKELSAMKVSPQKNIDVSSEESIREEIHQQKIYKMQHKDNESQIISLKNNIKILESEIEVESKKYETPLEDLEIQLETLLAKKEKLEVGISKRTLISEKLEKFFTYKKESKIYKEWEEKKEKLEFEEKKQKLELTALTTFKEKIKEAESIAIENIIASINSYVQEYLDLFFPNDPISVTLKAFKENSKQESKPGLNFEILYKETQPGSITCLSGGEYARVVLAFLLSMAEMFNSPIIMLDEPTASLDQESTSNVIEGIRKNFSKKLVIIIAHQVISGEFDREIKL